MPIPKLPEFLPDILGTAADVFPIPMTAPQGNPGALNYATGWPQATGIAPEAGGIAPERESFNAVYKLFSAHLHFLQSGSLYSWSNTLDYLPGAHILGSNGKEYIAQKSSGPNVPGIGAKDPTSDDGEFWMPTQVKINGVRRGQIAPYYNVTFGGSDGRRPIFWGETEADEDYVLCDGGSDGAGGNVPDLRGRMILGASDAHPAGSTGGSESHAHSLSGTVGETTLNVEQIASHAHTTTLSSNTPGSYNMQPGGGAYYNSSAFPSTNTGGSQPHTHTLSGASGEASNLPPYYALSFIMRIA
ncbi:hypothetical protein [Desulfovibrio sp.]|uniref:hypothetical protein n=1 Tax=Desulfovibrio sp. TaxID=885 RepID=UPI003AB62330